MPLNRTTRNWIEQELPGLIELGVVPDAVARQIRDHYGYVGSEKRVPLVLMVCGTLGGVLVGLGIILLFAHNWEGLSRAARTVLSFAPLLSGQLLLAYAVLKKPHSDVWRESTAVFTILALGACLALISQTYQIPGNLGSYLLVWSLLGLPVVYLADAKLSAVLYLAGITAWAGFTRGENDTAVGFWLLAGLFVPYAVLAYRRADGPFRLGLLSWCIVISAPIGLGLALEHEFKGIWILAFPPLWAAMYLFGVATVGIPWARWKRAYEWMGTVGTIAILLILTFEDNWRPLVRSGTDFARDAEPWQWVADCAPPLFFAAIGCALLFRLRSNLNSSMVLVAGTPIAVGAAFFLVTTTGTSLAVILIMNVYLVSLAVGFAVQGMRAREIGRINVGLLALGAWITARFFDVDMSFMVRGIVFILLGAAFLGVNAFLMQRLRRGDAS